MTPRQSADGAAAIVLMATPAASSSLHGGSASAGQKATSAVPQVVSLNVWSPPGAAGKASSPPLAGAGQQEGQGQEVALAVPSGLRFEPVSLAFRKVAYYVPQPKGKGECG